MGFLGRLHKLSYKTNIYWKNYIIVSAIKAWNKSEAVKKFLLNMYLLLRSKKFYHVTFLQRIEMICQLWVIFQIDPWWFVKFCKHYINLNFFQLLLFYYKHLLSGHPLIPWTKLLLLSVQLIVAGNSPYFA